MGLLKEYTFTHKKRRILFFISLSEKKIQVAEARATVHQGFSLFLVIGQGCFVQGTHRPRKNVRGHIVMAFSDPHHTARYAIAAFLLYQSASAMQVQCKTSDS
jgi:hypothetical protein